jgi:CubicO group peptidase (beta-lactamase class C family)
LDFEPGSQWAYSNSNYLLLGLIVEQTSGRPLATHLAQTFFAPLDLTMTLAPPGTRPTETRPYRANTQGQFDIVDWPWDLSGPAGIWATPTDLIRWADVYRTGVVGGDLVTKPQTDAVAVANADSRYGLGIFIARNGVLWHNGIARGFNTEFVISADRDQAIAVACNGTGIEPVTLVETLGAIWQVW